MTQICLGRIDTKWHEGKQMYRVGIGTLHHPCSSNPFLLAVSREIKYTNSDFYPQPLAHSCELHTI